MCSNKKRILIILLASLLLGGCQKQIDPSSNTKKEVFKPQEESYTLATVQQGTFTNKFSSKNVQIMYQTDGYASSDKTAKLKELLVKQGDLVKKDDVIATLDIDVSKVDLEEKQLSLMSSKEKFESDRTNKEDAIEIMKSNFEQMTEGNDKDIYKLQIAKTQSQYEQYIYQTEKSIAKQETAVQDMEKKITDNTLLAPFDGYVIEVSRLETGDTINKGDRICHLVSTEKLLIGVKENGLLRYNMKVKVTTKKINVETELTGRVVASKDVIPENKWADMTYIALDDPSKYEGFMNATVSTDNISLGNVLLVDMKAITTINDTSYVSIYDDGQIDKRYIVLGKSNNEIAWVLQGLSENQSVITK